MTISVINRGGACFAGGARFAPHRLQYRKPSFVSAPHVEQNISSALKKNLD
jgi:hypothetical protein